MDPPRITLRRTISRAASRCWTWSCPRHAPRRKASALKVTAAVQAELGISEVRYLKCLVRLLNRVEADDAGPS